MCRQYLVESPRVLYIGQLVQLSTKFSDLKEHSSYTLRLCDGSEIEIHHFKNNCVSVKDWSSLNDKTKELLKK